MRVGGGKAKGSSFERVICKILSLWITGGVKDDCFWRSAMSGGRATVAHKSGKDVRQAGDITAVASEGHVLTDRFFIECKHVKNLDVDSFLIEDRGVLAKFWKQAVKQAARHERIPLLIARENRRGTLLITQSNISDAVPSSEIYRFSNCWPLVTRGDGVAIFNFDAMMTAPFVGNEVSRPGVPRLKSTRGNHAATSQVRPER